MPQYKINLLLGCGHINFVYNNATPIAPNVGSSIVCSICGARTIIKKKGGPVYIKKDISLTTERNKKRD